MKKITPLLSLFLFGMVSISSFAQEIDFETTDKQIFEEYKQYIEEFEINSKTCLLQHTAEFFLDRPYVAGTLDNNETEKLVVNLREFDCVTFIETVIALANTVETEKLTFENYTDQLQKIRYRNGNLTHYDSRLHYTSEWVDNNVEKGILKPVNLSENVLESKTIDFMSTHRSAYAALKEDDKMLEQIKLIEDKINLRDGFSYLPKVKINASADQIPHMAMLGFTTSIKGLDTTHTGFAYHKDGKLTFIHASSLKQKVVIDELSLADYCMSQKSCTGLIIMKVK